MSRRFIVLAWCLFEVAPQAHAAGGHHAVDDATLLDPGQCQLETWADRQTGGAASTRHLGSACRVGPVELGLAAEYASTAQHGSITSGGPQLKWAQPLGERWSAGIVLSAAWRSGTPRFVGSSVVVPVSWQASEEIAVHANLGRDFVRGEADATRSGLALEWSPISTWSFVAERFREFGTNHWRVGARWMPQPAFRIDLGQARGLRRDAPDWWTLGLTWVFDH